MQRSAIDTVAVVQSPSHPLLRNAALVVGASVLMAICGRLSVPLPFTPIPLTLANFGVLLIGLALGSRIGFAALVLYLAEGAVGLPVFSPAGPGGIAQLLGPTGGYLIAYPFVAFLAGWIAEHGSRTFVRFTAAALAGELLLFASGISWIVLVAHVSFARAAYFGLYPFFFAEVMKVLAASAAARPVRAKLWLA